MFTALTSIVPTRVSLKTRGAKSSHKVNKSTVAYTNWMLDGVGCSGARSDDSTLVKSKYLANNVVHCPVKPIDLTSLCQSHEGRFEMLDVLFEQHGDDIFVSNLAPMDTQKGAVTMTVDGDVLPPFAKTVLKPGSRVQIGDELYEVNRNVHAHA